MSHHKLKVLVAKTVEERRQKEGHDSVRMWDKLWAGWEPGLPMEPDAIQLRGPAKENGEAEKPRAPTLGEQEGKQEGKEEAAGGGAVPVSDTEGVDQDVMAMAAEAGRQELHPEPSHTAQYSKQTWDMPGVGEKMNTKNKKKEL